MFYQIHGQKPSWNPSFSKRIHLILQQPIKSCSDTSEFQGFKTHLLLQETEVAIFLKADLSSQVSWENQLCQSHCQHREFSRVLWVLTKGCLANLAAVEMKLTRPDGSCGCCHGAPRTTAGFAKVQWILGLGHLHYSTSCELAPLPSCW